MKKDKGPKGINAMETFAALQPWVSVSSGQHQALQ
jgi:hypothetical protein